MSGAPGASAPRCESRWIWTLSGDDDVLLPEEEEEEEEDSGVASPSSPSCSLSSRAIGESACESAARSTSHRRDDAACGRSIVERERERMR